MLDQHGKIVPAYTAARRVVWRGNQDEMRMMIIVETDDLINVVHEPSLLFTQRIFNLFPVHLFRDRLVVPPGLAWQEHCFAGFQITMHHLLQHVFTAVAQQYALFRNPDLLTESKRQLALSSHQVIPRVQAELFEVCFSEDLVTRGRRSVLIFISIQYNLIHDVLSL